MFLRFVKYSDNTGIIVLYPGTFFGVFFRLAKSCLTWQWLASWWHGISCKQVIRFKFFWSLLQLIQRWNKVHFKFTQPMSTNHYAVWIADNDKRSIFNHFSYLCDVTWFTCFIKISCGLIFKFRRFFYENVWCYWIN